MRYRFEKRRYYYGDKVRVFFDRLIARVNCARGKHWVKFGTAPYCAWCGRKP